MKQIFYTGKFRPDQLAVELLAAVPALAGTHARRVRDNGRRVVVESPNLSVWYWPPGREVPDRYGVKAPAVGLSIPDDVDEDVVAKIVAAHEHAAPPSRDEQMAAVLRDETSSPEERLLAMADLLAPPST